MLRYLYIFFGGLAFVLGVIGAFLPLWPTTPFLILAAFFFSKGSDRIYQKLRQMPYAGKRLIDWEDHGVIRKSAKWLATGMILPLFSFTVFFVQIDLARAWVILIKSIVAIIGVSVLVFIWSRPSEPVKEINPLPR